jgi:predicted DNA-binding transcriptional regulator AlpA
MTPKPRRLIRRREVLEMISMRRNALHAAVDRGDFPKPIRIFEHGRVLAWDLDEVETWLASRFEMRS